MQFALPFVTEHESGHDARRCVPRVVIDHCPVRRAQPQVIPGSHYLVSDRPARGWLRYPWREYDTPVGYEPHLFCHCITLSHREIQRKPLARDHLLIPVYVAGFNRPSFDRTHNR